MLIDNVFPVHSYCLFNTLSSKSEFYNTRREAEIAMHNFCSKHDIVVECTEHDKHEREYTSPEGIKFYINRI